MPRNQPKLYDLLRSLSTDMHMTSSRPCETCRDLTEKLGWKFGCYEWQEAQRQRQKTREATDA